jgi:flagellin-like protein
MKIGRFKVSRRAVSPVIATLLMIAIAVAASIIVYVWSIGLLGGLMQSGGGAQTAEQLILEAYGGGTTLTVRNVGTRSINMTAVYLNGVSQGVSATENPVDPGVSSDITIAQPSMGISSTVKIVSRDGGVFVFSVVGGQAQMIAPTIYAVKELVA